MKLFLELRRKQRRLLPLILLLLCMAAVAAVADDAIPCWLQFAEASSRIENALFRTMTLPGGPVSARRPPRESRPLLDDLVHAEPNNAELYSLRALQDEQQLDFEAAEKDWKLSAEHSADKIGAQFTLADFYHRRLRPADEIVALSIVAEGPSSSAEQFTAPEQQQSWRAFERIFSIIAANVLPTEISDTQHRAWIARYPHESKTYIQYFDFLLAQKQFDKALALLGQYSQAFPQDSVFGVKARALLEYRRGDVGQGLAVYEQSFQPLWPKELVQGFFDLLRETQNLRKFLDQSRVDLRANPNDLNAAARIFYYYQQDGKSDAALQILAEFRQHKESTHTRWTSDELFTLARLCEDAHAYSESSRYYYALYNSSADPNPRERALNGLANLLLSVPNEPLQLGAGDLSFYKDVATADSYPGFFNGIVSLLLNSESPRSHFAQEEQLAIPYFHQARAAELIALLDQQFPNSPQRPALRAHLVQVYADYGQSEIVIRQGQQFLKQFPNAAERTGVSLLMADAYERLNQPEAEFAIYDAILKELAEKAHNVPIGAGNNAETSAGPRPGQVADSSGEMENSGEETPQMAGATPRKTVRAAFSLQTSANTTDSAPPENKYVTVLGRYLGRLVTLKRLPQALDVLRHELDRNQNDPGLYERLADFLQQNQLEARIEEVYRRAMQQFPDRSWYDKLARYYLRQRREADFSELTEQVVRIFSGTELEDYMRTAVGVSTPRLELQFNLYANRRFPHDLAFVRNLLSLYRISPTRDDAAWEALVRRHWFEADDLRDEFFEYLSVSGQLERDLAAVQSSDPAMQQGKWEEAAQANPLAVQFYAEAELWRSHFEASLPALGAIAAVYPTDFDLCRRASSVYRSLAYFDPKNTDAAARIERNLLQADPGNRDTLARIGDIYADRELFAQAAPFWKRMTSIEPGKPDSFVQPATIFWDYYHFDDALGILNEGRKKLGNDALFGYEEGAIYENERDYPRAIAEYARAAMANGENSSAEIRLLALTGRPKLRSAVDAATRVSPDVENPPLTAIRLRVSALNALDRKADVQPFLLSVLQKTTALELAQGIETLAQEQSLEGVREQAIDRQASLTSDPVVRLQLRYRLAQFYESKKDFASAQRNYEALNQENPKILGVVRSTVDFYWRRKMQQRAIDVLLQAAKYAYPELRTKFTFEAARKSTEAANFTLARQLLDGLLQSSPYDAELLAAMADTYARAGDNAGLRDFYLAKIELLRKAPFGPDERAERIASLRRGLIPALLQLKDYSGAVDQYIELINRYPEDANLVVEAALAAGKHELSGKLVSFYAKTIVDSPRDYRWGLVLARIETALENYPAALDAYAKAIAVRADRADLFTARVDLFERLGRSEEAAADYEKLYALSYHDTQWMLKLAQVRARQGKPDEASRALKIALIESRPATPENFFAVAKTLESWGLLSQARDFARQGVDAAGKDLLADDAHHDGAQLFVREMTRLRRHDEAFVLLQHALDSAFDTSSLSAIARQVEKQGIAAVTDQEWRVRELKRRQDAARAGMESCMNVMGETVARYFTPEEKTSFQTFLESKRSGMSFHDLEISLMPAATSAGLAALEAQWRKEIILSDPRHPGGHISRLVELQSRRLQFAEVGQQLETIAAALPGNEQFGVLSLAADAYHSENDSDSELRVLAVLDRWQGLRNDQLRRYFELLLAKQPDSLIALAATGSDQRRDATANFALANASPQLTYQILNARAGGLPPVWPKAYRGLAGLYFADSDARVDAAFLQALDDKTIGERIGKHLDRDQQLAGDVWFYYGSRYGRYLGTTHNTKAEDYLPAELEHTPGRADAYLVAAQDYVELGEDAAAVLEYQQVLELAPQRIRVHDQLAELLWNQGNHAQAIAEWKRALPLLAKQQDQGSAPESFWSDFDSVTKHLRQHGLAPQFKPDADKLLRTYIHRNGEFAIAPLLHSAFVFLGGGAEASAWLVDLANATKDQQELLSRIIFSHWIPAEQRGPFFQRLIELHKADVDNSQGEERLEAIRNLHFWQERWVQTLLETKQYARASELLSSFAPDWKAEETPAAGRILQDRIQISAGLHEFDPLLQELRLHPETAPDLAALLSMSQSLRKAGFATESRELLEFADSRAIEDRQLNAPNFLGVAEARLASGNLNGALEVLRRLALVVGQPGENLDAAAALLEKKAHPAEASPFLEQRVAASPWDSPARLRLAKDHIAAGQDVRAAQKELTSIASSGENSYELRVEAAEALASSATSGDLGSRELNLLASRRLITPADANHPFFLTAREKASRVKENAGQRLALLGAALRDTSSADSPRIPFFFAAIESRQYPLAIAAMQPYLRTGFLNETFRDSQQQDADEQAALRDSLGVEEDHQGEEETETLPEAPQDEEQTSDSTESSSQPTSESTFSQAEKARVAANLALAEESVGRLPEALRHYRLTEHLETNMTRRKSAHRSVLRLRAELDRQATDAARRPVIHKALEQDHIVRPRLVELSNPANTLQSSAKRSQP